MITKENHLHNIEIIERAVLENFERIKEKYQLDKIETDWKGDFFYSYLRKGKFTISYSINKREAMELSLIEENGNTWGIQSRLKQIYPRGSAEFQHFFQEKWDLAIQHEKYSKEFYSEMINYELCFLEKHYLSIFTQGKMST